MVKKSKARSKKGRAHGHPRPKAPKVLDADRKFHQLLDEWRKHVYEEIQLHKRINAALAGGRRDFHKHLHETIQLHDRFVRKLKKL